MTTIYAHQVSAATLQDFSMLVSVAGPGQPPTDEQIKAVEDFLTGLTELTRKTGLGVGQEAGYYENEMYLTVEPKYGLEDHFYILSDGGTLFWTDNTDLHFFGPTYIAKQGR